MSQQSRPAQTAQPGLLSLPSALTAQQQQQQKLRLQRIQMERERIRMRQEELLRQVAPRILFYFVQEPFVQRIQIFTRGS